MPSTQSAPKCRADTLRNGAWLPDKVRRVRADARTFVEDVLRPLGHALNPRTLFGRYFPG